MALDLTALGNQLRSAMPKSVQRTDTQLREAASNKYAPIYNAQVEGAQQAQQQSDLSLAQRIERLLPEYQKNAENIEKSTTSAFNQQNRQVLSRGMQRSSYNNATLGNIQIAGMKALAQNDEQRTTEVNQINAQRSQMEQQLAQTLARLEADKEMNIAGYTDEMRQQDWSNAMTGYQTLQNLETTLAEMGYRQERDAVTDSQWQQQFDLQQSQTKKKSSSSTKQGTTQTVKPHNFTNPLTSYSSKEGTPFRSEVTA